MIHMSTNKSNKPELRFKGFSDDWEQRKFSKIFEEYSEKKHEELPPLTIIQGGGTVLREESNRNMQYDESSLSNYKMVKKDDFILHLRSFEGGLEKANTNGIISPAYHTFHGEHTDSIFYYSFFRSKYFIDVLLKPHVYGIRDGKSVDVEGMKSILVPFPTYDEQKLIGNFIERIDHLITLHQRKCDNLKIIKKSMLDNLFPKNGEKVPKWRFKGFNNDWEQRKLGDYLVQYLEVTTENNQYPVLTSSRKGIFFQKDYYDGNQIASIDNTGYNIVPHGYFTYRHMSDDEIFHFNINNITDYGIVSTLYPVFTTTGELDSKYLQYQLNYGSDFKQYAALQKQGGSRTYMYFNKLREFNLKMPILLQEQQVIAHFMINIDNLITLHQSEVERLKKAKQFFLDKMFI